MLVKDYMTSHPITADPEMRVSEAHRLMAENRIRHLPVVSEGKHLLGIVTPSRFALTPEKLASLDVWEITRQLSAVRLADVMVKPPALITVAPDATLEEAAHLIVSNRITGLPVVCDGILEGILTQTDLLIELSLLLGAKERGYRVTMRVPDRYGEYNRLFRAIYAHGWGIMALGSVRSPRVPDHWDLLVKIVRADREELLAMLKGIADQEIVDFRESELSL